MLKALVAKAALAYASRAPAHRGKARFLSVLGKVLGPTQLRTPKGPILEILLSSSMDRSYFRPPKNNVIDEITPEIISELKPGDCFIDIGANVGYLSLLASKVVGPKGLVVAVEPSPREYRRLLNAIDANKATNIVPLHVALGNSPGLMTLQVALGHTGLNRLNLDQNVPAQACGRNDYYVSVPVLTADMLLGAVIGDRTVGLVKIDTEGAEAIVIQGMEQFIRKVRPRTIVIEITPQFLQRFGNSKAELYQLLESFDYKPRYLRDDWQYDEVFELSSAAALDGRSLGVMQ